MTNTETTSNATTQGANNAGRELSDVMTDMLALGKSEELRELYRAEVYSGSWDRALAALVAILQANSNHAHATKFPNLTPPKIYVAQSRRGQRFLRIWREESYNGHSQRHAVGFVEPATGYLWKCAGWKAPETNFPRASMYDLNRVQNIDGGIYFYNQRYSGPAKAPGCTE